ncbi:DNA methyltransferase [Halobaculum rubrum]|uniref:DNA methyltransferase n=1 Tax=Halobaculum rubrum TaxID=2872158 RepID=UPI001CA3D5DF|nr:DNA methyltransferase [Halobaculum rubrum]QZY01201.1 ATP-binding protein [Halobaculum rubrum]
MSSDTCKSEVELQTLAPGMAKQHENYLDALQELIDNSVAATVSDESYFDDPDNPVNISISIVRGEDTVTTYIADSGPGISRDDLRNHVFRTGSKQVSDGILNNVGWGLKASIAWFEQSLKQRGIESDKDWFKLVTQTSQGPLTHVNGPITGDLPISDAGPDEWTVGIPDLAEAVAYSDHGTRIQVSCARTQFESDVWPAANSLSIKAQYIRERLGVLFRRLLNAHEDTQITIHYHDFLEGEQGSFTVPAITPIYEDEESLTTHEFEIQTSTGVTYDVIYRGGKLDIDAMTALAEEEYPEVLTQSGRFRYRYRPNQSRQGVDIYANGRVLMTSVFEDLFDLTRNNQYNYFGGELEIQPTSDTREVPTDNKKTRLDTNSTLWEEMQSELSQSEYHPEGKDYRKRISSGGASGNESDQTIDETDSKQISREVEIGSLDDVFGLHNGDTQEFLPKLREKTSTDIDSSEGFLDATITSPPYFDMKEYGSEDAAEVGQQSSYSQYLSQLQDIFKDVYTMTKNDGSLWVVVNTFRRNHEVVQLPFDIARICQNIDNDLECPGCGASILSRVHEPAGRNVTCANCGETVTQGDSWHLQDIIVWDKNHALPYTKKGRLRNVFEYILCFSKTTDFKLDMDSIRQPDPAKYKKWWADFPERYHPLGKLPENIWKFQSPTRGSFTGNEETIDHPAALPPQLIQRILNLSTDSKDVVLDPFAGSGVVVAQSEVMERRAIGVELNQEYCDAYSDVQEYVKRHYERREDDATDAIENLICGLRQVKYSRKLLEELASIRGFDSPSKLDIQSVIAVSQELGHQSIAENIHGHVDLVFVVDEETTARELLDYANNADEAMNQRPCSGFGIKADVTFLKPCELVEDVQQDNIPGLSDELFLYEDGRHYVYTDTIAIQQLVADLDSGEWVEAFGTDKTPPILSNLGLEVNHPKHSMDTVERSLSGDHEFIRNTPSNNQNRFVIEYSTPTPSGAD